MRSTTVRSVSLLVVTALGVQVADWLFDQAAEGQPDLPPPGVFGITATNSVASTTSNGHVQPAVIPNWTVVNPVEGEEQIAGTVEMFRVGPIFRRVDRSLT